MTDGLGDREVSLAVVCPPDETFRRANLAKIVATVTNVTNIGC